MVLLSNSLMTQEVSKDSIKRNELTKIDPLVPSKASFYSAVLPGLGQIYTKKYWKLPLIYGAIGSSIYGFNYNNKEMKRYRVAYKKRIAGYTDDEFFGRIPRESQLIEGYKYHRRYRDLSALFLLGFYLLNILDANIGAHLLQFNVNENLSIIPKIEENIFNNPNLGVSFNINFNKK
tara:strand:+ start:35624 stop:36154 length:531 start_codon:yes stop_codon:yes gene_type:complete